MNKNDLVQNLVKELRELWTLSSEDEQKLIQEFAKSLKKFSKNRFKAKNIQDIQDKLKEWGNEKEDDKRLLEDVKSTLF